MADIFVSYSHEDRHSVSRLVRDLRELGHSVTLDRSHFRPGQRIETSIHNRIERADFFIPVLTPNIVKSKWVRRVEIYLAQKLQRSGHRLRILPVVMGKGPADPGSLKGIKYVDLRKNYSLGLAMLAQELPHLDYDELHHLRKDLYACVIDWRRLLPILKRAAARRASWDGCTPSDLMKALGGVVGTKDKDGTLDDSYWWLIVLGVLRFNEITYWWEGDDHWKRSLSFAEISPRGIALLNELSVERFRG
jgi:TIR domain